MFWSNSGKVQICTKCISLHEISHLGPFTSIHTVTHENSQNTWAHSLGMDFQFTCLCPAIQIGKYVFSRRHSSLLIRQSIWWESLTFSNVTLNGLVWFDVLFLICPSSFDGLCGHGSPALMSPQFSQIWRLMDQQRSHLRQCSLLLLNHGFLCYSQFRRQEQLPRFGAIILLQRAD